MIIILMMMMMMIIIIKCKVLQTEICINYKISINLKGKNFFGLLLLL